MDLRKAIWETSISEGGPAWAKREAKTHQKSSVEPVALVNRRLESLDQLVDDLSTDGEIVGDGLDLLALLRVLRRPTLLASGHVGRPREERDNSGVVRNLVGLLEDAIGTRWDGMSVVSLPSRSKWSSHAPVREPLEDGVLPGEELLLQRADQARKVGSRVEVLCNAVEEMIRCWV